MARHAKENHIPPVPTDASIFYPEEENARLRAELTHLQARSS